MAVRATGLKNFKGEDYITRPELEDAIRDATGGESGLIDSTTGNLRADLNPIKILSMDNEEGMTEETIGEDTPNPRTIIRDEDYSKIKFIGNCKVIYGGNGKITIRIGDNVNCSLYNGTDGISTTTVTSEKSGYSAGVPSANFSTVSSANGSTSFQIFKGTGKITANSGVNETTADGPTSGNGNEVHFDGTNGKFRVYIEKNGVSEVYYVGPISANGTYNGKLGSEEGTEVTGVSCSVTQWGAEPKSRIGASGNSACVNFTITPSNIYSDSTAFKLVKIEMYEGTSLTATWTNSTTNGTYFYMKETTVPGTPSTADYSLTSIVTKKESGVTFLTTSTTFTATATDMTNIGYPAATTNKANIAPNADNAWFAALNDSATADFTTWTTAPNATMDFSKSGIAIKSGKFENPQVVIKGTNYNSSGTAKTSAKTNNKMWVYGTVADGSNITDNRWKSNFSAKQDYASVNLYDTTAESYDTEALQVYQGLLQYPSEDYSPYNVIAGVTNPDYSGCAGDRYYYMKFSKSGSMPSGAIDVTSVASLSDDISSGKLVFEIAKSVSEQMTWYNICFHGPNNGIGTSDSTLGSTSSKLMFRFKDGDASNNIWVRITMQAGCTSKISNVLLNGGSLV